MKTTNDPPPQDNDHVVSELLQQAATLEARGDLPQATRLCMRAVRLRPEHTTALLKLGLLLRKQGRDDAGLIALKRAAGLNPDNAAVIVELGMALKAMGQSNDAMAVLDRTLELDPHNIHAAFSKGELLLRTNRTAEAFAWFDVIVKGNKDADHIKAIARWLRGVARLTLGDYHNAWDDYEARVDHPTTTFPELVGERWQGQDLTGKRLFLAYEQRFGDVIQFSRFIPDLIKSGAQIILEVPPQLTRLFASLGHGVQLIGQNDPRPTYDYCQLVTSIPAILSYGREDVWRGPYLSVDERIGAKSLPLRPGTALKVGLVWAGKPVPDRSIPLKHYVPLLKHREVSFYSFQLGPQREQVQKLAVGWLIDDASSGINDFYDSSVLMQQMDLIITVDTAAAHQAGAMGLSTWLMLIYYSDWRWGAYGNATTPWYPSIRIFRQQQQGSWHEAAAELERAFAVWVGEKLNETESSEGETIPKFD